MARGSPWMSCGTSPGVADGQHEASPASPLPKGRTATPWAFRTGTLFVNKQCHRTRAEPSVPVAIRHPRYAPCRGRGLPWVWTDVVTGRAALGLPGDHPTASWNPALLVRLEDLVDHL